MVLCWAPHHRYKVEENNKIRLLIKMFNYYFNHKRTFIVIFYYVSFNSNRKDDFYRNCGYFVVICCLSFFLFSKNTSGQNGTNNVNMMWHSIFYVKQYYVDIDWFLWTLSGKVKPYLAYISLFHYRNMENKMLKIGIRYTLVRINSWSFSFL